MPCLQAFHDHYSTSHSRLMLLWRSVMTFRRQFGDIRSSSDRELSQLRNDMSRLCRSVQSSCASLTTSIRNEQSITQVYDNLLHTYTRVVSGWGLPARWVGLFIHSFFISGTRPIEHSKHKHAHTKITNLHKPTQY